MFKKGQVIRSKLSGDLAFVQMVDLKARMCSLYVLSGRSAGETLWPFPLVDSESEVIGNNYQERATPKAEVIGNNYQERATPKAEKPAVDKETHNLITRLRASNHRLRQMNRDLRDDIGDMASKLHLAYRNKFPGIAALWSTPEALPEQRGCRKEDC